jgi:DNA adenine methylase
MQTLNRWQFGSGPPASPFVYPQTALCAVGVLLASRGEGQAGCLPPTKCVSAQESDCSAYIVPIIYMVRREQVTMDVINVSKIPQLSPFRYPGGKTWLVPYVRLWLGSRGNCHRELVEPFAGGGIISLTAVFESLVEKATLVELDADVASVWKTIFNGQGNWLAKQIEQFALSQESVQRLQESNGSTPLRERALATLVRNRVNRGGILAPGAGIMRAGENGKGLRSRWYPQTISNRIAEIVRRKSRFTILQADGLVYLAFRAHDEGVFFFIDPPYTVAGKRLYLHSEIDHEDLFRASAQLRGDFLMTYDDATEIRNLARRFQFKIAEVPMKSTHHALKTELLIGRNLDWLKKSGSAFL